MEHLEQFHSDIDNLMSAMMVVTHTDKEIILGCLFLGKDIESVWDAPEFERTTVKALLANEFEYSALGGEWTEDRRYKASMKWRGQELTAIADWPICDPYPFKGIIGTIGIRCDKSMVEI